MDEEEKNERYISVEQSIIESLKQVRKMRAGKIPKKSWREVRDEIETEFALEESATVNERKRNAAL